jgi:hypothetical protein
MALDRKYIRQQTNDVEATYKQSNFWKPSPGKYRFRLIPGWRGARTYFMDIATHYNVGSTAARVVCPELTSSLAKNGDKCAVCSHYKSLMASGIEEDTQVAGKIRASHRYYINIYLRPTASDQGGLRVWGAPKTVFDQINSIVTNIEDFGEVEDPVTGSDFVLNRTGTGMNDTKYTIQVVKGETPLLKSSTAREKVLDNALDLTTLVKVTPAAEVEALLGSEDRFEATEEEDEDTTNGEDEDGDTTGVEASEFEAEEDAENGEEEEDEDEIEEDDDLNDEIEEEPAEKKLSAREQLAKLKKRAQSGRSK